MQRAEYADKMPPPAQLLNLFAPGDVTQRRLHSFHSDGGRMNKDTIQGGFTQLKGKIKQQWGKLTDDEIDEMEGHAEILAGKLQERYGLAKDEAERQAKDFRTSNNWN
jgi:uncharacterized protein YjbJ (UPF0337 family)